MKRRIEELEQIQGKLRKIVDEVMDKEHSKSVKNIHLSPLSRNMKLLKRVSYIK